MQVAKVSGLVDVDFASCHVDFHHAGGLCGDYRSRSLVTTECEKLRKKAAGNDGRRAARSGVGRSRDCGRRVRLKCGNESAKMGRREARLIAGHQQCAQRSGRTDFELAEASVNGCGDSLLPRLVEDGDGVLKIDTGTDGREMRTEDHKQRTDAGFASHAHGALKKHLPADGDKLLGLAQAAAFSGSEQDGGDGHRHKCISATLTATSRIGKLKRYFRNCTRKGG